MVIVLGSGVAFALKIACLPTTTFTDTSVELFYLYLNPESSFPGVWQDHNQLLISGFIALIAESLHLYMIIFMLDNIKVMRDR